MLKDNLQRLRKSRGLTQQELAEKLNVVRQTVSKWEKGLSVPDSELLVEIANYFEVPVSTLLGETVELPTDVAADSLHAISEKLSLINETLARSAERRRRVLRLLSLAGVAAASALALLRLIPLLYLRTLPLPEESSNSVIGGADAPTSIFVTSTPTESGVLWLILLALLLIASLCGLHLTRKR